MSGYIWSGRDGGKTNTEDCAGPCAGATSTYDVKEGEKEVLRNSGDYSEELLEYRRDRS